MKYDSSKDYKWVEIKEDKLDGYTMYVPEFRLHLYVLKSEKGFVGIGKFLYDEDNKKFNTKPFERMEDAKICLVNNLVTGLCNCQYKIMATICK